MAGKRLFVPAGTCGFPATGRWRAPVGLLPLALQAVDMLVPEGQWAVDPATSTVRFSVKHLLVATVDGTFGKVAGTVGVNGHGLSADGAVQVATIDTGMDDRDTRLRGEGFFDADRWPEIEFHATGAQPASRGSWKVAGELTIGGRTGPMIFTAAVRDGAHGPHISAHGSLSRSEHGLDWPGLLHSGAAVVGDQVEIDLDLVLC